MSYYKFNKFGIQKFIDSFLEVCSKVWKFWARCRDDASSHRRRIVGASAHGCTNKAIDVFWHLMQWEAIIQPTPLIFGLTSAQRFVCVGFRMSRLAHHLLRSESPHGASWDASFPIRVVKRLFLDVSTGRFFTRKMFIISSLFVVVEYVNDWK